MTGLKFLFKSWFKYIWTVLFGAAIFIGVTVLGCVAKEDMGSEDYLTSRAFLQLSVYGILTMASILGFVNLNGNKLIRSAPVAKELYTKSVPMFVIILTLIPTVISNGAYFISLAADGAPAAYYSDTLLCMAVQSALNIISFSLLSRVTLGGLLSIYVNMMPYIALLLFIGEDKKCSGFGLPVGTSLLIFAGAVVIASAIAFIVNGIFFKKLNFKAQPTAYAGK